STRVTRELAEALRTCGAAVILFDVAGRGEGLALCAEICRKSHSPLVLLASGDNEMDRLLGFQLDTVHSWRRPGSSRDVIAHTRAMLRRTQPQHVNANGLVIDTERYAAALDGHVLDLTPVEFRLLALFASEPGQTFERIELFQRLYSEDAVVNLR